MSVARPLALLLVLAACGKPAEEVTPAAPPAAPAAPTPYGANAAAGGTFVHDGVTLYYESYGTGMPLLLVHGNGGSIADLGAQIDHFRKQYRVIAMDSRDQGKSTSSEGALTYEKMTDDLAALLDHLKVDSVDVIGWSDGGIEALLLGLRHPTRVRKLVSMAANLNPTDQALPSELIDLVKGMVTSVPDSVAKTPAGAREIKVTGMMLKEPNIAPSLLAQVKAPTLVMAGDHDLIRLEHIVEIYRHLPNAQLAILPNSTHMVPYDNPELFNSTIERFLNTPFKKIDFIPATMESLGKLRAGAAH